MGMLRIFKDTHLYKLELTSETNISFFYTNIISEKDLLNLVDV